MHDTLQIFSGHEYNPRYHELFDRKSRRKSYQIALDITMHNEGKFKEVTTKGNVVLYIALSRFKVFVISVSASALANINRSNNQIK